MKLHDLAAESPLPLVTRGTYAPLEKSHGVRTVQYIAVARILNSSPSVDFACSIRFGILGIRVVRISFIFSLAVDLS